MKRKILSFALAFALVLSLAPAVGPSAKAAEPGTYNPGDIAVINAIIDNNGLAWDKNDLDSWMVHWSDDVSNKRITWLVVSNENLRGSLDVSGLTELRWFWCSGNQLTELDVSSLIELSWLWCGGNQLTELDVSENTALESLRCENNQLTALDVSHNTALIELDCHSNELTALDVSGSTTLTDLWCYFNQLPMLDVTNNTELTNLQCHGNQLTTLDVSKNTVLTNLACANNKLTTLDISKNTALSSLSCNDNQLTALDVSHNTALTSLSCNDNQLTTLDISHNTALTYLRCFDNDMGQDPDISVPGWRSHWSVAGTESDYGGFAYFPQREPGDSTPIPSAAVAVTPPIINATPQTTAPVGGTGYTCGAVTWTPTVPAAGKFQGRTAYTATVTLTANLGYTFPNGFTATINGKTATITNRTGDTVTITYIFPATAPTGSGVEVTVGVKTYPEVQVTITIFLNGAPIYAGTFPKTNN